MSRRGFVLYQPIIVLIFICMGVFRVQAAPIQTSQDASSDETKHVKLAVFDQPTGGEPLWEESHIAVPDEQGLYRVFMGAKHSEGVPVQFATGSEARWVGVQVEGEEEQPRILLAGLKPVAMGTVKSSPEGSSTAAAVQITCNRNITLSVTGVLADTICFQCTGN